MTGTMVIASNSTEFGVLFESRETAEHLGFTDNIIEVDPEYIQEDNSVYALHATIDLVFDQEDIQMIYLAHTEKEIIDMMVEFVEKKNLTDLLQEYIQNVPGIDTSSFYNEQGELLLEDLISGIYLEPRTLDLDDYKELI